MIRYNEFLVLLRRKNFKNFKNLKNLKMKDIISGSIGRVWVRVRVEFDPKNHRFFGLGLFRVQVKKKIVFRTQNFRADLGWVFESGQILTGLDIIVKSDFKSESCPEF